MVIQLELNLDAFRRWHIRLQVRYGVEVSHCRSRSRLASGIRLTVFMSCSSVATTGCVLAGQAILLCGVITEHLVIMASNPSPTFTDFTPLTDKSHFARRILACSYSA
jgi:hypothetical protein